MKLELEFECPASNASREGCSAGGAGAAKDVEGSAAVNEGSTTTASASAGSVLGLRFPRFLTTSLGILNSKLLMLNGS